MPWWAVPCLGGRFPSVRSLGAAGWVGRDCLSPPLPRLSLGCQGMRRERCGKVETMRVRNFLILVFPALPLCSPWDLAPVSDASAGPGVPGAVLQPPGVSQQLGPSCKGPGAHREGMLWGKVTAGKGDAGAGRAAQHAPEAGLAGYRRSERRVRVALAACRSLPSYPGPANKPLLGTQAASGGGLAASVKGLTPRLSPASRGVRVTPRCLLLPPSITGFDNALPTPRSRLGLRGRSSLPVLLVLESGLLAGAPGDAACVCRGGGGAEEGGGISRLGLQA